MDNNKLKDVLRKARLFIECSPLKIVENNLGCLERDKICAEIDSILSTSSRNCDVGTAEEQAERMDKFCDSHGHGCDGHCTYACENCEFVSVDRCELAWAQMPYKEGGAK